ncbi:MAG: TonB-dependent hemoglobin/transferrin/lactoferrin family receptor [Burkholderiaceae bacterium]
MLRISPFLAVTGLVCAPSAFAQAPAAPEALPEVAITATRIEEKVSEVPATISVIGAQAIDRNLVTRIEDLVRYEPGVSVARDPSRFGASSFNIRGLDGNRVAIQVDGIRAPNSFSFGSFAVASRDVVDLDAVKRVEILRGPSSTLYGSDALGGVVAYLTKDPLDYLDLSRSPVYAAVKSTYSGVNAGWANTATLAAGTARVQGLVVVTRGTAHETDNQGGNDSIGKARTAPNPQDIRSQNVLAKLVGRIDEAQTVKATFERFDNRVETEVLSLNALTPKTTSLTGEDHNRRERVSLDYAFTNPQRGWLAGFNANLYHQSSSTDDKTLEVRANTSRGCSSMSGSGNTCVIPRAFNFEQKTTGGNVQVESLVEVGGVPQRILWGGDIASTDSSSLRDARLINLTTGSVSNTIAGETLPTRDFPNGRSLNLAAYVQDQISFADDRFVLTPGLRFDAYRLQIEPDSVYLANVPAGVRPSDFSDQAFSPKLAALYRLSPTVNAYGQIAAGFRTPGFDDLNGSFQNLVMQYALIPNPDLKSETSRGIELGLKGDAAGARFGLSTYYNQYRDFIDSRVALDCPSDPRCLPGFTQTFQSVNRDRVRIWGVEARGDYAFDSQWSVAGSLAYANGRSLTDDAPLNSVNPFTAVASLIYAAPNQAWGGATHLKAVARKTEAASVGSDPAFLTPGYATVDLTAWWRLGRHARIEAGVFNLFDRKYWSWSDVGGAALASNSAVLDRYTQPGRNASVSLHLAY